MYSSDIPHNDDTSVDTFVDNTSVIVFSSDTDPESASFQLRIHLDQQQSRLIMWKIKINESKRFRIDFAMRIRDCSPVNTNDSEIPPENSIKKSLNASADGHFTRVNDVETKQKKK